MQRKDDMTKPRHSQEEALIMFEMAFAILKWRFNRSKSLQREKGECPLPWSKNIFSLQILKNKTQKERKQKLKGKRKLYNSERNRSESTRRFPKGYVKKNSVTYLWQNFYPILQLETNTINQRPQREFCSPLLQTNPKDRILRLYCFEQKEFLRGLNLSDLSLGW